MCKALVWSFDLIASINWLEVIKALAPVATAIIAFLALRSWRRQDKAKREAEFLDAVIEAVHVYVAEMATPVTVFRFAKIGMESHVPTWESDDEEANAVKGAILYIQKNGERDAKRLLDMLEAVRPSIIKLKSLAAKGQVFGFADYAKCHNAIVKLAWNFDRVEGFAAVIGSTTWNWLHPDVLERLKAEIAFDADDIGKSLGENNIAVLKFAAETYKRIYGTRSFLRSCRLGLRRLRRR